MKVKRDWSMFLNGHRITVLSEVYETSILQNVLSSYAQSVADIRSHTASAGVRLGLQNFGYCGLQHC